jgi:hypothetical protein
MARFSFSQLYQTSKAAKLTGVNSATRARRAARRRPLLFALESEGYGCTSNPA